MDSPRVELLIQKLEDAILIASDLEAKLVVELLRMAILASYDMPNETETNKHGPINGNCP